VVVLHAALLAFSRERHFLHQTVPAPGVRDWEATYVFTIFWALPKTVLTNEAKVSRFHILDTVPNLAIWEAFLNSKCAIMAQPFGHLLIFNHQRIRLINSSNNGALSIPLCSPHPVFMRHEIVGPRLVSFDSGHKNRLIILYSGLEFKGFCR
jgi:hypothetical protein